MISTRPRSAAALLVLILLIPALLPVVSRSGHAHAQVPAQAQTQGQAQAAAPVRGTFTIHLILHAVGQEEFTLTSNADGTRTLTTTFDYTDRTTRRTTSATLTTTADERPLKLDVQGAAGAQGTSLDVDGARATLKIGGATRTLATPPAFAAVSGPSPFALQMMMMRAWRARGEPAALPLLNPNADAPPLQIVRVGKDTITAGGRQVTLERFTVNNLMFGREILWTTSDGMLAAAMTFAGGLPMEAIRSEYVAALPQLYRAGVAQQMANLDALGRAVPAMKAKAFAIDGATLIDATRIDGTGAAAIDDAVVIVRDGRIVAAGARAATATATGLASATPVPAAGAAQFTVASFNLERFFDTVPDPATSDVTLTAAALEKRLKKASLAIRIVMRTPDILGVEEVENLDVLNTLANRVNTDTVAAGGADPGYFGLLVEGNDPGGIDVGFLIKSSRVTPIAVVQEGKNTTYTDPNTGQQATLNDRPPLVLRASVSLPSGPTAITVIVNHLRSLNDLTDPATGARVRAKRAAQAEFLANLVQARQIADPTERIVLVGDFNAFQFNDGYVDMLGTIAGQPTPADQVVVASPDLVDADLLDVMGMLPASQRYSYLFDGHAQILDHVLVNQPAAALFQQIAVARNGADFPETFRNDDTRPERLSDHDMPVAYFAVPVQDVSARVSVFSSGLVLNRVTRTYNGTIQITNTSAQTIAGPIHVALDQLTAGVTLANAAGQSQGLPYVTASVASLASGQSTTVAVQFNNPANARIGYVVRAFAGTF